MQLVRRSDAFDDPDLNGKDVRKVPLAERKRLLRAIVPEQVTLTSRPL